MIIIDNFFKELYENLTKTLSNKETLQLMNNIATYTIKNPNNFTKQLLNFIEEKATNTMVCPNCFTELSIKHWQEYRGEFHGFPANEDMFSYYCENCGWEEDE